MPLTGGSPAGEALLVRRIAALYTAYDTRPREHKPAAEAALPPGAGDTSVSSGPWPRIHTLGNRKQRYAGKLAVLMEQSPRSEGVISNEAARPEGEGGECKCASARMCVCVITCSPRPQTTSSL